MERSEAADRDSRMHFQATLMLNSNDGPWYVERIAPAQLLLEAGSLKGSRPLRIWSGFRCS